MPRKRDPANPTPHLVVRMTPELDAVLTRACRELTLDRSNLVRMTLLLAVPAIVAKLKEVSGELSVPAPAE